MTEPDSRRFKDDMVGRVMLGRYRIVRRLASGGMGIVYLARSEGTAGFVKPVVVKVVHPHFARDSQFADMFIREAQILSHLQHAGIVNVIEFAEEKGTMLLVLEYVNGFQLREWVRYRKFVDNPLPTPVLVQVVLDMLEALHYAHTLKRPDGELMRIVHRDISPSNVLVDMTGRAKILDFGIAFVSEGDSNFGTRSGSFKGKLTYSAPELFSGAKASVQSDVYSCGIVLHQLLLGRNEFSRRSDKETIARILSHEPSSVLEFRSDVPSAADPVIQMALAKDPKERYQSADELRKVLSSVFKLDPVLTRAQIADLASEDFGQEMADYIDVESLSSRDRAWREPSILPPQDEDLIIESLGDGSVTGKPKPDGSVSSRFSSHPPGPTKGAIPGKLSEDSASSSDDLVNQVASAHDEKSWFKLAVVAALVVLVIGAFGSFFFLNAKKGDSKPNIVVVQSPVNESQVENDAAQPASENEDGVLEEDASTTLDGTEEETPVAEESALKSKQSKSKLGKKNGISKTVALSRAFRKRKGSVTNCFKNNAMQLESQPQISINFEIDKNGKVQSASIAPASVSTTPLGKCLRTVAERTKFPAQGEAIAFRIPVTAWKVPKQ